jgi:transposase
VATLLEKKIRGKVYFYEVESRRVPGKRYPVLVNQRCLGSRAHVLEILSAARRGQISGTARLAPLGAVAALFSVAERLGLVDLIDAACPKRNQARSVGEFLLWAAINRAAAPCAKRDLGSWVARTAVGRAQGWRARELTGQRFYDHAKRLDGATIRTIQLKLAAKVVKEFGVSTSGLAFDCTNFDTFIESTTRGRLAKRGHAKSKRTDLRLVGLALAVSTDFEVPLFHDTYAGNRPDVKSFRHNVRPLIALHKELAPASSITVVRDAGNNSEEADSLLEKSPLFTVGSIPPSQCKDLYDLPLSQYRPLTGRLKGVLAYRTTREVAGQQRTLVVTMSPALKRGQRRGLDQHVSKRLRVLADLSTKLQASQRPGAKGKGYTAESLRKRVDTLLHGQHVSEVLRVAISTKSGKLALRYSIDQDARRDLIERVFGKRFIFTDREDWTDDQIVLAYRSQHHVEAVFRWMKAPAAVPFGPMYHWTTGQIRVHSFVCVLAMTLATLVRREMWKAGVRCSMTRALKTLRAIKEVTLLAPGQRQSRRVIATAMSHQQRVLWKLWKMNRWIGKSVDNTKGGRKAA